MVLLLAAVVNIAAVLTVYIFLSRSGGRLLPGPKGLPILGNLRDLPPPDLPEWQFWSKHITLYGLVSSITILGRKIVLVHDRDAAIELLEKRANKSSFRPHMVFANDLMGLKNLMAMQSYGQNFRQQRKLTTTQVGSIRAVEKFQPAQEQGIHRLLQMILEKPGQLKESLVTTIGSVMLQVLYGYSPQHKDKTDALSKLMVAVADEFSKATTPGAWMVDLIPWIKHMPDWMPGASFKKTAKLWNSHLRESVYTPYEFVREQMSQGQDNISYVSGLIRDINRPLDDEEKESISWSAAALFAGGTDTSSGTLYAFFLAMILHPEIQHKAQKEIDRVTGGNRLPTYNDRHQLPYIDAMVEESLRWHPVLPLAIPHMMSEDDHYGGYDIPKDALLVPSIGWFAHDPEVYKMPEEFRPDRFLAPECEPPASRFCFGFGRRVCPGRYLAHQTLFTTIAQVLAVFDIRKDIDQNGIEIQPAHIILPGVLSHVKPFPYRILPRSDSHRRLIVDNDN